MTVYVVTIHYSYESGWFDSAWSTKEKAEARAKFLEKVPFHRCDWTEVSKTIVDKSMGAAKLCEQCGQPVKAGKRNPGEYEHATGCPKGKKK
jgi:hypothetical protein